MLILRKNWQTLRQTVTGVVITTESGSGDINKLKSLFVIMMIIITFKVTEVMTVSSSLWNGIMLILNLNLKSLWKSIVSVCDCNFQKLSSQTRWKFSYVEPRNELSNSKLNWNYSFITILINEHTRRVCL